MRSELDSFSAIAREAADLDNPHRLLAVAELERLARHHRAMAMGEAIADAILWVARLPGRLVTALRSIGVAPARQGSR